MASPGSADIFKRSTIGSMVSLRRFRGSHQMLRPSKALRDINNSQRLHLHPLQKFVEFAHVEVGGLRNGSGLLALWNGEALMCEDGIWSGAGYFH
jgi:hypothetical protein